MCGLLSVNSSGKGDWEDHKTHPDLEARFICRLNLLYKIRECIEKKSRETEEEKITKLEQSFLEIMDSELTVGKELSEKERGLIRELVEGARISVADPNHIMDWATQRKEERKKLLEEMENAIKVYDATTYIEF